MKFNQLKQGYLFYIELKVNQVLTKFKAKVIFNANLAITLEVINKLNFYMSAVRSKLTQNIHDFQNLNLYALYRYLQKVSALISAFYNLTLISLY
jgi:hypothetical protein